MAKLPNFTVTFTLKFFHYITQFRFRHFFVQNSDQTRLTIADAGDNRHREKLSSDEQEIFVRYRRKVDKRRQWRRSNLERVRSERSCRTLLRDDTFAKWQNWQTGPESD